MPDTDRVNCIRTQAVLKQGGTLTADQAEHLQNCEECREAWLEAALTTALEAKPQAEIPPHFAERVAANLPARRRARQRWPHWGLLTASLLVAALLVAVGLTHPHSANSLIGQVFMGLIAAEIAGIALWLGQRASG